MMMVLAQQHLVCEIPKKRCVEILDGWNVENAILSFKHGKLDNSKMCTTPYIYISFGDFFRLSTSPVFFPSFSHFCEYCERVGAEQKAENLRIPRISCWIQQLFCWENANKNQKAIQKQNSWVYLCKRFFLFLAPQKSNNFLVTASIFWLHPSFLLGFLSKYHRKNMQQQQQQKHPKTTKHTMNCTQEKLNKNTSKPPFFLGGFFRPRKLVPGVGFAGMSGDT